MGYINNIKQKGQLGFAKGYITIFQGETYTYADWFRVNCARYSPLFGWYFTSENELPDDIPEVLTPIKLTWDSITLFNGATLKSEEEIKKVVDSLLYPTAEGEFVGEIGERIHIFLTVEKVIAMNSYYGDSYFHIMTDDFHNYFTWTTTARKLEEGHIYCIAGTVKDHKIYRGHKQTQLSRCVLEK